MWISHIVFAVNFYKMVSIAKPADVKSLTVEKLSAKLSTIEA
jgi:hypothetical protein